MKKLFSWPMLFSIFSLVVVVFVWTRIDLGHLYIDRDWARDLKEISNIHRGDIVWLGPWLNPGLHASSSYYYFYYLSVLFAQGHPLGMVYFNLGLFILSLGVIGYFLYERNRTWAGFMILSIGLTPMMLESSFHPGNGFSYVALVLLGIGVWLSKRYLWVSSLSLGIASSFHPGALLILPILIPSYLRLVKKPLLLLLNIVLLIIPWLPLIGYEVLTKGFITRQFLSQPSSGSISFDPGSRTFSAVASLLGLPTLVLIIVTVISVWVGYRSSLDKTRLRFAWLYVSGMLLFLSMFSGFLDRYLYAVAVLLQVLIIVTLQQKSWGKLVIAGYAAWLLFNAASFEPMYLKPNAHTVNVVVTNAVSFLTQSPQLQDEVITVLSALPGVKLDPQGDDYRSFLRFKGYDVVDVTQNSKAEYLVIFVEDEAFEWEGWSNWELEQFGEKQLERIIDLPKGKAVVYQSTTKSQ